MRDGAECERFAGPDSRQYEVTPIELFFDLVYVFAISQLSHYLLEHLTWTGLAETVVLYLPVFQAWAFTTWAVTLTDARRAPVRWMLLISMLFGLFKFVATLARRIASFPSAAIQTTKRAINELTLPPAEAVRADGRRFQDLVAAPEVQDRSKELFGRGLSDAGPAGA